MWDKLRKAYPLRMEIIPLALAAFSVFFVAYNYATLPESIPTHFDISGSPDKWGARSEILLLPVLAVVIYALFTGPMMFLAAVKDPKRWINLPPKTRDRITPEQVEKLRIFLSRALFALKVLTQGLLLYNVYITIDIARHGASGASYGWMYFISAILLVTVYLVWKALRIVYGKE